jgi:hypothetical protein
MATAAESENTPPTGNAQEQPADQVPSTTDTLNPDTPTPDVGRPTEEPTQEPTTDTPTETKPTDPEGYEGVHEVKGLLEEAGLTAKDIVDGMVGNDGKISIDAYKKLVDKHGEAVANLLVSKIEGYQQTKAAEAKKADEAIYNQVQDAFTGITEQTGEETWKELSGWAKDNVNVQDRKSLNDMLQQGGLAAKLAVNELVSQFKNSDSFQQPANLVQADDTSDAYGIKPLDKVGYDRELRKLLNEGHDYNTSPEIAQLNARRTKAINRGY